MQMASTAVSPTRWQASTFPPDFQQKISIIHEGIDTSRIHPNPDARLKLNEQLTLTKSDEIITFAARNLEPYRGFHIFMRALPSILLRCPTAHVLIAGEDGVSYGNRPAQGKSWRQIFTEQVKNQIADSDWQRVHFLGKLDYPDFITLLQVSSVHIYLTYPFVLSWSLLEAMSAGCAIIASDTAPVREAITNDQTGKLVNFLTQKIWQPKHTSYLKTSTKEKPLVPTHALLSKNITISNPYACHVKFSGSTNCLAKIAVIPASTPHAPLQLSQPNELSADRDGCGVAANQTSRVNLP